MSGGKGGSQTSQVEIPQYLEDASKKMLNRASAVQGVGYMPYMGPDVAALTQPQQQAMQSNIDAASAFGLVDPGLNAMAGMPEAQDFNGVQGYSSFPLYEQAVADLAASRPGQVAAYDRLFVDPSSGVGGPGNVYAPSDNDNDGGSGGSGGGGGDGPGFGDNGGAPSFSYTGSGAYNDPSPVGHGGGFGDNGGAASYYNDISIQDPAMLDTIIPDIVMGNSTAPNMVMPNNAVNFQDELLYSDPNLANAVNTGTFAIGNTPASGLLDSMDFNRRTR
tara:strand:- start:517 stop:1344 length:828 start_codon:yes stop_codon:yes gene_type:complete